jgi:hypothetical protein
MREDTRSHICLPGEEGRVAEAEEPAGADEDSTGRDS